jgi:hypothetical protein
MSENIFKKNVESIIKNEQVSKYLINNFKLLKDEAYIKAEELIKKSKDSNIYETCSFLIIDSTFFLKIFSLITI